MTASPDQVLGGIADRVTTTMAPFADVSAARIFGTPVEVEHRVVIPAAAFDIAAGFGYGGGNHPDGGGSGGGGGGGGQTQGRPVAVIEITSDGVRVIPVFDWTRLGLAAIATALTVWRVSRRR